jgi:hypothetical protein
MNSSFYMNQVLVNYDIKLHGLQYSRIRTCEIQPSRKQDVNGKIESKLLYRNIYMVTLQEPTAQNNS